MAEFPRMSKAAGTTYSAGNKMGGNPAISRPYTATTPGLDKWGRTWRMSTWIPTHNPSNSQHRSPAPGTALDYNQIFFHESLVSQ